MERLVNRPRIAFTAFFGAADQGSAVTGNEQATGPRGQDAAPQRSEDNGLEAGVVAATPSRRVRLAVAAWLQDLGDAPAVGGSADRHTDVRGSGPHVGNPQEVVPD